MSKYRTLQCLVCGGIGIVKRERPDICIFCNNDYRKKCSFCEFKSFKGNYIECKECLGVGEHWIDKNTNKKVLVWCLSK